MSSSSAHFEGQPSASDDEVGRVTSSSTPPSDDVEQQPQQPSSQQGGDPHHNSTLLPSHTLLHPIEEGRSLDPIAAESERIKREWEQCRNDPFKASPMSKYDRYSVAVDHSDGDRALQIQFLSLQRPHMRSFHCAWISFFLAFMIWFAPAPLLKEIGDTLHLSKQQLWTSSIANDCTAIFMRILMGPVCDKYGARLPMAAVLVIASIPTACVGLIETASGLALIRLGIGIAGSSFVMAQFWPSRMFGREIAGTANGTVGGWGNLGGAFTQVLMGTILFPAFTKYFGGDSEKSWRTICVIPAAVAFAWGLMLPFISDDAPMGNYREMKKNGSMDRIFFTTSLKSSATTNTWILFIQYACSFGVELVMNNASVLYYTTEFGLTTDQASVYGFLYGSMNIFARGLGGYISDKLNAKYGMRGRLWWQTILLVLEGAIIIVFSFTDTLAGAVVTMCIFSIFTQAAEGAIYGIVPYVSKLYTGAVAGFVGSGGNVGSVIYGFGFRQLPYDQAFLMMGSIVIAASTLNIFINIPCHAGLIWGEDNHAVIEARQRYAQRHQLQLVGGEQIAPTPLNDDPVPSRREQALQEDDHPVIHVGGLSPPRSSALSFSSLTGSHLPESIVEEREEDILEEEQEEKVGGDEESSPAAAAAPTSENELRTSEPSQAPIQSAAENLL